MLVECVRLGLAAIVRSSGLVLSLSLKFLADLHPGEAVRIVLQQPYYDSDWDALINEQYGGDPYAFGIFL